MKGSRAIKFIISALFMLNLLSSISHAVPIVLDNKDSYAWPEGAPEIKAASAILSETERGQVLYGKNMTARLHIAALNKLMTILVAVESGKLNANVTISKESVDAEGSALSLEVGEKYTLEELLYGIMLTSANDAAKAVAEHIAGSTDEFTDKMNATAEKLMMKNTHFSNTTGLFDENQYTTAEDIHIFMNYALKNTAFNRIFGVQLRPWTHEDGNVTFLPSQNKLFWSYDGVDGGKTGYNEKDKQTLISTVTRGNIRLICILLDSPEKDLFSSATALYDYGYNNYRRSLLVRKNEVLTTAEAEGNTIDLICSEDVYYLHPIGEQYVREYSTKTNLKSPVKKTVISGTATYTLKDGTMISVNLYPANEIVPPEDLYSTAKKKITENKDIFYLVIFLLGIEAILILANILKLFRRIIRKLAK